MEKRKSGRVINEKKLLTIGGILIFLIVAIIAYFEWKGKHRY